MKTPTDPQNQSDDSPEEEWLARALCATQDDYVMDAGFTTRVTDSLPSKRHVAWRRPLLIGLGTAIGILISMLAAGRELISIAQYLYQQASEVAPLSIGSVSIELSVIMALVFSGAIAWISCWRSIH